MAGLQTRNSVMAIMEESTEGTPVVPAAATDFVALQDGFSLEPAFNNLQNNELKSSIGLSKSIVGLEAPKAGFSHYLRHSGTEGTAPNYRKVLKCLFGSEVVASTQYALTAASTTTLLKMSVGNGQFFQRGQAMLIKDGTNGYSIRPVHSVATDDITIGFKLANAPASGVNTGKAVLYKPANSGHPTLTLWDYRANGGAVEAMSGCRVTDGSISVSAGELINAQYSFEGVKFYFDPIVITSSVSKLDFLDNAATRLVTVTATTYKDPYELADAIETAMNALGSANTFTCDYDYTNGKFTFTSTGTTLTLKWNTGANTANSIATKVGFTTAADSSGALTYTSANAMSFAAPFTPTYDSADPLCAKDMELIVGDSTTTVNISASKCDIKVSNGRSTIKDITSSSGISGSVIKERKVEASISAILTQYDADKFYRMRSNTDTRLMLNFGVKSGGSWVAGKCGCFYLPTAVISDVKVGDQDGLVSIDFTVTAYVDSSGNGEAYLSFV
jgi:hypothetical protein